MNKYARLAALMLVFGLPAATPAALVQVAAASPQQAVDDLLAADRAFAVSAATLDTASALAAMFHDEGVMSRPRTKVPSGSADGS